MAPESLVETGKNCLCGLRGTEPPLKCCAREAIELTDAAQAKPLQEQHGLRRKAQGLDGKGRKARFGFPWRRQSGRGCKAGLRVRGAKRIGEPGSRRQPEGRQPRREIFE